MDTSYSRPTSTELRQFSRDYGSFDSFLAEFLDVVERTKTLQEILTHWLLTEELEYYGRRSIVVKQGRAFMQQSELPWTLIPDSMNWYFATKEEAFAWLADALEQIEKSLQS